jgi:hypothetical protein
MKKILMIHEVEPWMLELDLSEFDEITFDDGLYSQYKNYKHFLKYKKPLLFFISTNIVCEEVRTQNEEVIKCSDAHKLFFEDNNKSNYMTWNQIKEIEKTSNCKIGGHSHFHKKYKSKKIKEIYEKLTNCTKTMMDIFNQQEIKIIDFCYPYNKNYPLYETILKKEEIINFYGEERIAIEELKEK